MTKNCILMSIYRNDSLTGFRDCIKSLNLNKNDVTLYLAIDGPIQDDLRQYITSLEQNTQTKLFQFEESEGLTKRLNFLIDQALNCSAHQLFFRMDADDVALNERILKQSEFMKSGVDIDVVASHSQDIWPDGKIFTRSLPLKNKQILRAMTCRNPIKHSTVCFRRSILERGHRYNEYFKKSQDRVLWVDILKNDGFFEIMPEIFIEYRHNDTLIMRKKNFQTIKYTFLGQLYAIFNLRPFSIFPYFHLIAMLISKLLPTPITRTLYRKLEK